VMNIFVSEFVCGGAWPEERIETSLAHEGRLMLTALVEDLSRLPDARVVTTWDGRLGECPLRNCDVRVVETPEQERLVFVELIRANDAVWVIAPETDHQLARRRSLFDVLHQRSDLSAGCRFIGSSRAAIRVCSNKLFFFRLLGFGQGITTPVTVDFDPANMRWNWWDSPIVIKPSDGAGSQDTYLIRTPFEYWTVCQELKRRETRRDFVLQPFVPGKALSVALLIAEDGSIRERLPVAEQHLSTDGRFRYQGGRIPADISAESAVAVQQLAERACRAWAGLKGYVGCDIVLADENIPPAFTSEGGGETCPVLIEINPRLTTSYLGYRQLTDGNIPARLLDANTPPLRWKSESVTFMV
jgi:tyramine---L-glutamate ligase